MQLKNKLNTLQIGGSVTKYFLMIKGTSDALALVGELVKESDHVNAILHGLTEEYSSVYTSVLARSKSITVAELEALLLAHESMLAKFRKPKVFMQANIAQFRNYDQNYQARRGFRGSFRGRGGRTFRGGRSYSEGSQMQERTGSGQFNNDAQFSNGRGQYSRGQRMYNARENSNRPQCQLCDKVGHIARTCWYRYSEDQY
ncbi:uncharacterized protein [Arachis hypogaea]|uniref:uncharacterized protein n=1 Tax=Arachis hypogaea TaxID=3818 RepID=UPI000DECC9D1|nr:uncharacterized protein LOC112803817 [Arachis hypogaea]